jgi:hypothetical protein
VEQQSPTRLEMMPAEARRVTVFRDQVFESIA